MGKTVFVTGQVDTVHETVILSSSEPPDVPPTHGGPPPKLFVVEKGDEIAWTFDVKGDLKGRRLQVRCVEFAVPQDPRPLFERHPDHVVAAASSGGTAVRLTSGPVSSQAFPGPYTFAVELAGADKLTTLKCLWAQSPGSFPISVSPPMGGGEKRGGPG